MFTFLVIAAALLIVVALTAGLALLFDDGVEQPAPRPERRNVDPHPIYDWAKGEILVNDDRPLP